MNFSYGPSVPVGGWPPQQWNGYKRGRGRGGGGGWPSPSFSPSFSPSSSSSSSSVSFLDVFVLVILVIILLSYMRNHYGEVEYVKSSVDGRKYLVRKLPDKKKAANMLAKVNVELATLVDHMVKRYGLGDQRVAQMKRNFNPDNVSEGGLEHGYTSYSVNKGEKIVLCIRQSDNAFVSPNVLLYVSIHELAHLMTKNVGHTSEFWKNFKWLLREAVEIGIYERINYAEQPQHYCGIRITSSVI